MKRIGILLIPALLGLAGCAGKMDAKRGLSEEWRLRSLEENFLNFKEAQRDQEERSRDQQRKIQDRLKALEEAVAAMQGQAPARLQALPATPKDAPKESPKPVAAAPALKSEPSHGTEAAAEPLRSGAESGEEKPWAVVPGPGSAHAPEPSAKAEAPARSAEPSGLSGQALYNKGMGLVRDEHAAEGRALLQEFLAAEPSGALVPNALYWIGESHYVEKNYPQAILSLKEVTRRFPKHHKAAAAMYKIGLAYEKLGEKDNATLYLRALLQDHPRSEPAPAARKKLADLGG